MMEVEPVRFGVLGAAAIAKKFVAGLRGSSLATVDAIASRTMATAEAFAVEMDVPRRHASYDALLADPAIEAIYVPLPNHMHAEWAIKALNAGKHVLCEKPLAIGAADARAMFAAAREAGRLLVEAYPYMSQPQTLKLRSLLAEGAIGPVQMVTAAFTFAICAPDGTALRNPDDIRLDPVRGGGALLDAGTYPMSLIRLAVGERPKRVFATGRWTPGGVDLTVAATLEFRGGATAQLVCSMAIPGYRHAAILGESGVIETSYSNHAMGPEGTLPLRLRRGTAAATPFETIDLPSGDGFRFEAESFARMIRQGPAAWNGASEAESVDTALSLEALLRSLRDGGWVTLDPAPTA